jgi:hypothetical protein
MGRQRGVQYEPGSFYRLDDRTGFARRSEDTEKEWTGLIVGKDVWEARQPQDFVRGVPDDQSVPQARPVPPNVFVGPFFIQLAQAGQVGDLIVYLVNVIGVQLGDPVGFFTDEGVYFYTHVLSIDYANSALYLDDPLPAPVPVNSLMTDFINPKVTVPPGMIFDNALNSQYIGLIAGDCNG